MPELKQITDARHGPSVVSACYRTYWLMTMLRQAQEDLMLRYYCHASDALEADEPLLIAKEKTQQD